GYTRDSFKQEKATMVRINQAVQKVPYLVPLFMSWEDTMSIYFVMPLYPWNLNARLACQPLSIKDKLFYCAELIAALQALSRLGIVHHDIKSTNVLVDFEGRAVLADYGLAAVVEEGTYSMWKGFEKSGTPAYMATEILAPGHSVCGHGSSVDVWSLGITFLEIFGFLDRWDFDVCDRKAARRMHAEKLPIILELPADVGDMPAALLPWVRHLLAFPP
ncbi:kinase-like domain-containing protein, partial [Trametes maxima]